MRARTNMPGKSWRCGLSTSTRMTASPVPASTLMPENRMRPVTGCGWPSAPRIVTGSLSAPPLPEACSAASAAAGWRTSTYTLSICWMRAIGVASARPTSAPSVTSSEPMRPAIGASILAKARSRRRRARLARACATVATACSRWATASSYAWRLMASASTSGFKRSAWLLARFAVATACCRAAAAESTSAWNGAGLSWNSFCPAFTSAPCSNWRRSTMPPTCGRISAVRKAATRPGNSSLRTTGAACSLSTVTAAGGAAPSSGAGLEQAARLSSAAAMNMFFLVRYFTGMTFLYGGSQPAVRSTDKRSIKALRGCFVKEMWRFDGEREEC